MSACRTCGAEVIWAQTANGKTMPVDVDQVAGGNIDLQTPNDPRDPPVAHVVRPGPEKRHRSHFASCAHADQHRRAR